MEIELESSINLLKTNKKLIIEKIEKTESFEEKDKLFQILSRIDDEILKNFKKLQEIKENKTNKKLTLKLNSKITTKPKLVNISFKLTDTEIKEIIHNKNYIPIKHLNETNHIKTNYIDKSNSKNYIFYICKNRKSCKGRGKISLQTKEFIITHECDENANHNNIEYNEFCSIMKEKQYNKIDFSNIEIQKYYVYYLIYENNSIDNPTIKKSFYNLTNRVLSLNLVELSRIRNKVLDKYKNFALEDLISKLQLENLDIYIKILDLKYENKKNNNTEFREQRIIIFGLNEKLKYLKNSNTIEFFLDSTFKIIPAHFRPYKLLILAFIPKIEDKPQLITFILM